MAKMLTTSEGHILATFPFIGDRIAISDKTMGMLDHGWRVPPSIHFDDILLHSSFRIVGRQPIAYIPISFEDPNANDVYIVFFMSENGANKAISYLDMGLFIKVHIVLIVSQSLALTDDDKLYTSITFGNGFYKDPDSLFELLNGKGVLSKEVLHTVYQRVGAMQDHIYKHVTAIQDRYGLTDEQIEWLKTHDSLVMSADQYNAHRVSIQGHV